MQQQRWSIYLGRWFGVPVRLHALFVVLSLSAVALASVADRWLQRDAEITLTTIIGLAILFVSVLVHEWAHVLAAWRLGGGVEQIVLGPAGGLAPPLPPRDVRAELAIFAAGPVANLLLGMLAAGVLLAFATPPTLIVRLLHPLQPPVLESGMPQWVTAVRLTVWINSLLILLNALPVFPFDAARILPALVLAASPDTARRRAEAFCRFAAQCIAAGLVVAAWWLRDASLAEVVPSWFILLLLAILIYFNARYERPRRATPRAPAVRLRKSTTPATNWFDPWKRYRAWRLSRHIARVREAEQQEAVEEQLVDEILQRLHQEGIDSLTGDERQLLERVSRRYRERVES